MGTKRRFLYRYKWFIQKALMSRGYMIRKIEHTTIAPIDVFDLVLRDRMSRVSDFFFLQIGANDGVSFDPIHPYVREFHWRGILVEPVPYLFQRLKANYSGEPQLRFEQAAVAEQEGEITFYAIRDASNLPADIRGLGSLSRDVILAHRAVLPNIESLIEEIKVPAITVMGLIAKHGVEKLDLLQIDTEGYDYEVIKMIDFSLIKPAIVHFEHVHLSSMEWRDACALLASHGYRLAQVGLDTVAYLQFPTTD